MLARRPQALSEATQVKAALSQVPAQLCSQTAAPICSQVIVALTSLMTGIKVRNDVAMTGEITLRGNVLPIGGVKEKVLGALRAGVREVIMPERNKKDLIDVPESVKTALKFHFVNRVEEVLEIALERPIDRVARFGASVPAPGGAH